MMKSVQSQLMAASENTIDSGKIIHFPNCRKAALVATLIGILMPAHGLDIGGLGDALKQIGAKQKPGAVDTGKQASTNTDGEIVFTSEPAKSFDEAAAKAIHSVKDGQPLYFHLRTPKPLGKYVYSFSEFHNALQIALGPEGNLRENYINTPLELTAEEMKASELHIALAPAAPRSKGELNLWTAIVGQGRPGTWRNEIRIMTYPDTHRLDAPVYIAIGPITADVEDGIDKYRAMNEDYARRKLAGDPDTNAIPVKVARQDQALANTAMQQASRALGAKPDAFYFTDDGWYDHRNSLGQLEYQRTMAAILYKDHGKCYAQGLDIAKWPNGRIETTVDRNRIELSCKRYADALSSVR